jgi:hypothetical protein
MLRKASVLCTSRLVSAQFTCFTGTKVQVLTQKARLFWGDVAGPAATGSAFFHSVYLLVQKYKY